MTKLLLETLAGKAHPTPPIWLMRQAGRYLPEYRETRAQAGGFLDLCYNPELAAEVTLQPIRRYGFDASILFADILLVPQAIGAELWFAEGEGPRLTPVQSQDDLAKLDRSRADETLSPIYETVKILRAELPKETTLIGFAGAPWTVATYMVAGRGTTDQGPARGWMYRDPAGFSALIDLLTDATIDYLSAQIEAGAEVVMLFDSWAGALASGPFQRYSIEPARKVREALQAKWPDVPMIGFPRGAGQKYEAFVDQTGAPAVALDSGVDPAWARDVLQPKAAVQGNLDPALLVAGGDDMVTTAQDLVRTLRDGPFIFNLGHGITPDTPPDNVARLVDAVRSA